MLGATFWTDTSFVFQGVWETGPRFCGSAFVVSKYTLAGLMYLRASFPHAFMLAITWLMCMPSRPPSSAERLSSISRGAR
eukprot:6455307-Pyramimonas_sp.AAC.1